VRSGVMINMTRIMRGMGNGGSGAFPSFHGLMLEADPCV
jgi:hypothetical protein